MGSCQLFWTLTGDLDDDTLTSEPFELCNIKQDQGLNSKYSFELMKTPREELYGDKELSCEVEETDDFYLPVNSLPADENEEKIITADEVIKEIDDILDNQYSCDLLQTGDEALTSGKPRRDERLFHSPEDLAKMSAVTLQDVLCQFDDRIKQLSKSLVSELDLRDELEFDKELKNQFISLVQSVQKKRRQCRKKSSRSWVNVAKSALSRNVSHVTTTIPVSPLLGHPSTQELQAYTKILKAINEDSPRVPSLLTDYILNFLCLTDRSCVRVVS